MAKHTSYTAAAAAFISACLCFPLQAQDISGRAEYAGIKAQTDIRARSSSGHTPLMTIAASSDPDTLRTLIDAGADVNAQGYDDQRTALMFASIYNTAGSVKTLIDAGADINAQDTDGRTALMYAAMMDKADTVRLLIQSGADMDMADKDVGLTALMFAAAEASAETVSALLDAGADARIRTMNWKTAFDYALLNEGLEGTPAYEELRKASE